MIINEQEILNASILIVDDQETNKGYRGVGKDVTESMLPGHKAA